MPFISSIAEYMDFMSSEKFILLVRFSNLEVMAAMVASSRSTTAANEWGEEGGREGGGGTTTDKMEKRASTDWEKKMGVKIHEVHQNIYMYI